MNTTRIPGDIGGGRKALSFRSLFTFATGNPLGTLVCKDFLFDRGSGISYTEFEGPAHWTSEEVRYWYSNYAAHRDRSVTEAVTRVTVALAHHGLQNAFFATGTDGVIFRRELMYCLLRRHIEFNTSVWRKVAIASRPPTQVRVRVNIGELLSPSASDEEILHVILLAETARQIIISMRENVS